MMKKVIILIAIMAMTTVFILSGCGQTNKPQESAASQKVSASAQAGDSSALADLINSAKKFTSITTDFSVTVNNAVAMSGTLWYDGMGKMMKIKTTVSNIEAVEIINLKDNTMTGYVPSTKTGQTSAAPAGIESTNPGNYLEGVDTSKLTDLGTDTVNGYACRVVSFPSPDDSTSTIKMWIATNVNFPTRIEVTSGGNPVEMNYTNINTGVIPVGTFDIPSDITIAPAAS